MKTTMGRRWLAVLMLASAMGCGSPDDVNQRDIGTGGDGMGGDDGDPFMRGGRDGSGGRMMAGTGGGPAAPGTGGAVASSGGARGTGGAPAAAGSGGAAAGTGGTVAAGTGGAGPLMCEPGGTGKPRTDPCHGACVNTHSTDVSNCGGCDARCPAGSICHDGGCLDPVTNEPTRATFPMCPLVGTTQRESACGGRKFNGNTCYKCDGGGLGSSYSGYDISVLPCSSLAGVCVGDCNDCI